MQVAKLAKQLALQMLHAEGNALKVLVRHQGCVLVRHFVCVQENLPEHLLILSSAGKLALCC